jgi:hypothetical protein
VVGPAINPLRFEHQHRIVGGDGFEQQALGIVGIRRRDDHEAGLVRKHGLRRLAVVVAALDAAAERGAQDQRARELAA